MGYRRWFHWCGLTTFLSVQCPTSPKPVLREGQLGSQQSRQEASDQSFHPMLQPDIVGIQAHYCLFVCVWGPRGCWGVIPLPQKSQKTAPWSQESQLPLPGSLNIEVPWAGRPLICSQV